MKPRRYKYSPADFVLTFYLAWTGIFVVIAGIAGRLDRWWLFAVHHLLMIIGIFVVSRIEADFADKSLKSRVLTFVRNLYPLFIFGAMYRETHELHHVFFTKPLDYYFVVWDELLFKSQPCVAFAEFCNAPWFSEILHFFYFSFFFLIVCLPLYHWFRKDFALAARRVFDLSFTFTIFFSLFVMLPVYGPRVAFPPAVDIPRTGYFFGPFFERLFTGLKIAGAAFPSSHSGISAMVAAFAVKDMPKYWPIVALFAFGVFLATVFGRFHYAVDVIYGAALGFLCYMFADEVYSRLESFGFRGIPEK